MNNVFSLLKHIYNAIKHKSKKFVLFGLISGVSAFMVYYIQVIHSGNENIRSILTGLLIGFAVLPWLVSIPVKIPIKILQVLHLSGKHIFLRFILSCSVLWILAGVFMPSMIIASSPEEFSFLDSYTTPDIFISTASLQALGLFLFWPLCLYFLFSECIKKKMAALVFIICISALVNVFLFPGDYGYISIDLSFDLGVHHSIQEVLFNAKILFVIALVIIPFFFVRKLYQCLPFISALCIFALLGLSVNNFITINRGFNKLNLTYKKNNIEITEIQPIFHLSKIEKNTIVIMLDRAVNVFVPYIFEENQALYEKFSGFIRYPNTVSFHKWTRLGSPPLFGGYEYTPLELAKRSDEPIVKKHNEALLLMPRIFSEAGFDVTVTDQPYQNYSQKPDLSIYEPYPGINAYTTDSTYTQFWINEHNISLPVQSEILKRNLLWYGLFRMSPLAFREGLYLTGDWCSPVQGKQLVRTLNGYAVLDYLTQLTDSSINKGNTAIIMVNNTTHEPSFLQAPEYRPVINVTNFGKSPFSKTLLYHVNAAALNRLGEWFDYLKSENVYDNTRIIIAADHGAGYTFVNKIDGLPFIVEQYNQLLLVKDFNATGTLKTDMTFMTNADIPSLAFDRQIENPVNPFTGKQINSDAKKNPQYISIDGSIHIDNTDILNTNGDYYVHDNIFDSNNWTRVEE